MTRFEREWEDQTRPIDRVSTDTGRQLDRLRQGRCDRYLLRELRETDSWLRRCKAYIRIFIDLSLLALTLTRLQPWLNTWHYTFIQISIFNGIGIEQARDSRLDSRTGWELLKEMAHREVALFTLQKEDLWTDDRLNSRADDRDRCERSTYTYVYAADPLPYFAWIFASSFPYVSFLIKELEEAFRFTKMPYETDSDSNKGFANKQLS